MCGGSSKPVGSTHGKAHEALLPLTLHTPTACLPTLPSLPSFPRSHLSLSQPAPQISPYAPHLLPHLPPRSPPPHVPTFHLLPPAAVQSTYREQEDLVWQHLSGLVRDAAWLKVSVRAIHTHTDTG